MYKETLKNYLDKSIVIIILPLFLFILFLLGPLIFIQDRGTIFYTSDRLGKNGKTFKMYKFRTMKLNAPDIRNEDGSTFNSENDPRLTSIGKILRKTSLDELPQILNVLKGDMSLIGPRPDLPEHNQYYVGKESNKLLVKPGITGYNQAYFRNTITWKERLEKDVYYVENLSFLFDVKIFIKTIESVFGRKNIYISEENATGEKNNGET